MTFKGHYRTTTVYTTLFIVITLSESFWLHPHQYINTQISIWQHTGLIPAVIGLVPKETVTFSYIYTNESNIYFAPPVVLGRAQRMMKDTCEKRCDVIETRDNVSTVTVSLLTLQVSKHKYRVTPLDTVDAEFLHRSASARVPLLLKRWGFFFNLNILTNVTQNSFPNKNEEKVL